MLCPCLGILYQIIVFARYLRLTCDLIQYWGYIFHPMPIAPTEPKYTRKDITILICTTGEESRLIPALRMWNENQPAEIIIITAERRRLKLESEIQSLEIPSIRIHAVTHACYRQQMIKGLFNVRTEIVVITDDAAFPTRSVLKHLADCFSSKPAVGGVTITRKIDPRNGRYLTTWESFGALNQVRRRIIHTALSYLNNGQVLNLAGGFTGARTRILQSEKFYEKLSSETWLGRYKIETGEDNTTTRFIVQNGWKTTFLNSDSASVHGVVCNDWNYVKQLKRWSRDTARSYAKDMCFAIRTNTLETYIYSFLNITSNYATDLAVTIEILFLLLFSILPTTEIFRQSRTLSSLLKEHLIIASLLTLLEHLPHFTSTTHLIHVPGTVLYMYIHAVVVLYSIITLHKSKWDSRPEVLSL